MELLKPIAPKVWRHWEVWAAFAAQTAFFAWLVYLGPQFPYKVWVLLALSLVTLKVAAIPHNHYLALYLMNETSENRAPDRPA